MDKQLWSATAIIIAGYILGLYFQTQRISDLKDSLNKRIDDLAKHVDEIAKLLSDRIDDLRAEFNNLRSDFKDLRNELRKEPAAKK